MRPLDSCDMLALPFRYQKPEGKMDVAAAAAETDDSKKRRKRRTVAVSRMARRVGSALYSQFDQDPHLQIP